MMMMMVVVVVVMTSSRSKEESVPFPAANIDTHYVTPDLLPVAMSIGKQLPTFRKTVMPQLKVSKSRKVVVPGDTSMELRSAKGRFSVFTHRERRFRHTEKQMTGRTSSLIV
jgi:hypothetical protein